jgi:hypothetical protein
MSDGVIIRGERGHNYEPEDCDEEPQFSQCTRLASCSALSVLTISTRPLCAGTSTRANAMRARAGGMSAERKRTAARDRIAHQRQAGVSEAAQKFTSRG